MTEPALLNEVLTAVAPREREAFVSDYRALPELAASNRDLPTFLHDYLQTLLQLYAAPAGAIWCRAAEGPQFALRSAIRLETLGMEPAVESTHDALIRYAATQPASFLVPPLSRPHAKARISNPTQSFILLGPAVSQGDRIAVVELILGSTPERAFHVPADQQPAQWLDHLLDYLVQGIEQRFQGNLAPLQPALTSLESTRSEIEAFKDAIRISLEITLNNYAGWNFGSLRNNQNFARSVHELLDANSLRVQCPECGAPAILRCQSAGNSKTGVFLYDHYLEHGRTFHGGPSTFPLVKLVAKPPRRRSK